MLTCFPTPYPDELLYSVFARYHIRSGNTSPKVTQQELFSCRTKSAVIDMPCGINSLLSNMPSYFDYKPELIIINHTLFPYYTAFLSTARTEEFIAAMKSDFGGDIHAKLGIMASPISTPKFLRFCPDCNKEDINNYGENYWHRLHQLPGVIFCPNHITLLQNSKVSTYRYNKHEYIASDKTNCIIGIQNSDINSSDIQKHIDFALEIEWLFNNYKLLKDKEDFQSKYVEALKTKGLATPKGRVYQKDFIKSFVQYYGTSFLLSIQSNVDYDFADNWLSNIVRKHRKAFHPIRHLLIIRYLYGSLKNFPSNSLNYRPFGQGPWPCLNAAAKHYLKEIINEVNITQCSDTKLPVGTFDCSCGFIYSRRGPDSNKEDSYHIGRIKSFGLEWENELRRVIDENLSLREIARKLNVDPKTVKKCAIKLNIGVWGIQQHAAEKLDIKMNYQSIRIKEELNKKWHCNEKKRQATSRIDWNSRDKSTLRKVKNVVYEIYYSEERPERITISLIGKKIGSLTLLERHLDKMPLSKDYIRRVSESVYEYQKRRIRWAVQFYENSGEELRRWKVLKLAGIKSKDNHKFNDLFDEIFSMEKLSL